VSTRDSAGLSPETLDRLARSHRDFVAFVEKRIGSRALAEDIVQSAFVRSMERGGVRDEESAVAWFYRVLRNAVIDHYRRQAASERAGERLAAELPRSQPAEETKEEICRCLAGILETLKPEYRTALDAVEIDGASLRDLAAREGISENNAAVRLHRARKALRERVKLACGVCAEHGCFDCACAAC
jgi:RNA polymerase sigma-70 factor (ECF subfamily)